MEIELAASLAGERLASFVACIDEDRATEVLSMCTEECIFVARGQQLGREALEAAMKARSAAAYASRHHVGCPRIVDASDEAVSFATTIVSHRSGEGVAPMAVVDFAGKIVMRENKWLFSEIEMRPFGE